MKKQMVAGNTSESSSVSSTMHAVVFFSLVGMLLCSLSFVMHSYRPKQTYFTYKLGDSVSQQAFPRDEPNVTTSALLNWAMLAATNAHTFNFVEYEESQAELSKYFTRVGYKKFLSALRPKMNKIIAEKLVLSATPIGPAIILWENYSADEKYTWHIQVPLLLTYTGPGVKQEQYIVSSLTVTTVPTTEAEAGIGITQMVDGEIGGGVV